MAKCCIEGCERTGDPQEGFDFYLCDECNVKMQELIESKWRNLEERHKQN